ncbi:MAG: isoaspartyl peptidase/L-asparaginase, partial [Ruegeria sp.]|nr:isoaspartyl peptidase/L-asparaginase [Ruegeria sp.]
RVARAVMEKTDHVFLIGSNALRLAESAGVPFQEREYFFTQKRWDMLQETLHLRERGQESEDPARRHGTVGAVALDIHGNLAAATSTGGMTAKAPGRVGDTPCIGAGTFADNETCAVSATGYGEVFLQRCAAHEIASRMKYAQEDIGTAANWVVLTDLAEHGGSGGVIAVDRLGNIAMPFNCNGMYRGAVRKGEKPIAQVY